jgi:hypothetical protein
VRIPVFCRTPNSLFSQPQISYMIASWGRICQILGEHMAACSSEDEMVCC